MVINIGHVDKISVSGYRGQRFKPQVHQYVVSLSKILNLHCFSRISCEMSTRRDHPLEGCLFSDMHSPEEISLKK